MAKERETTLFGPRSDEERGNDADVVDLSADDAVVIVEAVLGLLRRKWVFLIFQELQAGAMRFFQIRQRVKGIQPKVLRDTLRFLEREGLVDQVLHDDGTGSKSVAYALTDLGRSLKEPLTAVCKWGQAHLEEVRAGNGTTDELR
jgi:DNA-binding HxlR family transcriptional regulator